MNLLAIDTSTDYLSVALMKNGKIAGRFHKKKAMAHSTLAVPVIDKVLRRARLKAGGIDCFAVSIGPGSFTGLRIGVSVVKGLAFSLNKPVVTIATLDVIACNVADYSGVICPVLDARKNKVYAALYRSDGKNVRRISEYLLLPIKELHEKIKKYDKTIFLGDAADLIKKSFEHSYSSRSQDQTLLHKVWHPKAEVVARLGWEEFRKKKFVRAEDIEPMYLYSKECDITGT